MMRPASRLKMACSSSPSTSCRWIGATALAVVCGSWANASPRLPEDPPASEAARQEAHAQAANVTIIVQKDGREIVTGKANGSDPKITMRAPMIFLRAGGPMPVGWLGKDKDAENKQADDDQVQTVVEENIAKVVAPRYWLGVGLEAVEGGLAKYLGSDQGALIINVFPDSPAAKANLHEGDIILAFDGKEIGAPSQLAEALAELGDPAAADKKSEAKTITLKILRRGENKSIEVTPTSRPEKVQAPDIDVNIPELQEISRHGGSIVKFGDPVTIAGFPMLHGAGSHRRNVSVVIVKVNEDGKSVEVRIENNDGADPKITVTDDDGQREIKSDQIESLPTKVREAVREALKRKDQAAKKDSEKDGGKASEKAAAAAAAAAGIRIDSEELEKQIRKQVEEALSRSGALDHKAHVEKALSAQGVFMFGPEELADFRRTAEKMAEAGKKKSEQLAEFKRSAEKMAEAGKKKAEQIANMPAQIEKLEGQVQSLQKQVRELEAQLKAKASKE